MEVPVGAETNVTLVGQFLWDLAGTRCVVDTGQVIEPTTADPSGRSIAVPLLWVIVLWCFFFLQNVFKSLQSPHPNMLSCPCGACDIILRAQFGPPVHEFLGSLLDGSSWHDSQKCVVPKQ